MTESASSWLELRYASSQPLPGVDGIRDELDGIAAWTVEAVLCFHGLPDEVVARSEVAVFDLEAGVPLTAPAAAYGGRIAQAAELLLDPDGGLREDLGLVDVDKILLFSRVEIGPRARGRGLAASFAIRDRIGSRRSLIGDMTDPSDTSAPPLLRDVPAEILAEWRDQGLHHLGGGLWLVPPDGQRITASSGIPPGLRAKY